MLFEGSLLIAPMVVFLRVVDQVGSLGLLRSCTCVVTVGQDDGLLSPLDVFFRSVSQVCLLRLLWSSAFHLVLIPPGFSSLVTCAFLAQLGLGWALVVAWRGFSSHLESATWLLTPGTFIVVACLWFLRWTFQVDILKEAEEPLCLLPAKLKRRRRSSL